MLRGSQVCPDADADVTVTNECGPFCTLMGHFPRISAASLSDLLPTPPTEDDAASSTKPHHTTHPFAGLARFQKYVLSVSLGPANSPIADSAARREQSGGE